MLSSITSSTIAFCVAIAVQNERAEIEPRFEIRTAHNLMVAGAEEPRNELLKTPTALNAATIGHPVTMRSHLESDAGASADAWADAWGDSNGAPMRLLRVVPGASLEASHELLIDAPKYETLLPLRQPFDDVLLA
jgi:hypothetical protein